MIERKPSTPERALAGLDGLVALNTVDFDSRAFAFDAALSGQAVAIFDTRMTAANEANGHLVRLHPLTVERPQGIHVVFPKARHPDPRIEAFAAWLQNEANLSGNASTGCDAH